MPRLAVPQVVARGQAEGGLRGQSFQGVDVRGLMAGAGAVGDAAFKLQQANEVRRLKLEEDEALSSVQNTVSDLRLKLSQQLEDAKNSAAEGAPGFVAGFMKSFDTMQADAEKSVPELGKQAMRQQLRALREQVYGKAFEFEVGSRERKLVRDYKTGEDADSEVVGADPGQLTEVMAARLALGSSLSIPPDARRQLTDATRARLPLVAAMRLAETAPGATIEALKDPQAHRVFGLLTGEHVAQVRNVAEREMQRSGIELRQALEARVKDTQAMALDGREAPGGFAPTVEQFNAVYGARGPDLWQAQVGNYVQAGREVAAMRAASPEDRAAIIARNQPAPGAGYADKDRMHQFLVQANEGIRKQLETDPLMYAVAVSPWLADRAALMNRTLADASMPAQDKEAAVDLYARRAIAEQTRLGALKPALLSKAEAQRISQQFHEVKEGGASAADLVDGLEKQWGRWWPTVFGQLASEGKMPAAALVIPNMADRGARARLAALSVMKEADIKAMLPAGDAKDVSEKVQGYFSEAAGAFLTQGPNGAETISKVLGQAEKLALFYRAKGASVGDAAKQAYTETMGHAYTFAKTYRVPKGERPDLVVEGADVARKQLVLEVQPFAAPGLTADEAKRQTLDAVNASAEWVTADDESGLQLVARGRDGGLFKVRRPDGTPYAFSWAALRSAAMDERTAQALSAVTGPRPEKK